MIEEKVYFKYDHENDGCHITTDPEHTNEIFYLTCKDLEDLFQCLMVDRIKEVWKNNQNVSAMLSQITEHKRCTNCDGTGTMFKK